MHLRRLFRCLSKSLFPVINVALINRIEYLIDLTRHMNSLVEIAQTAEEDLFRDCG